MMAMKKWLDEWETRGGGGGAVTLRLDGETLDRM